MSKHVPNRFPQSLWKKRCPIFRPNQIHFQYADSGFTRNDPGLEYTQTVRRLEIRATLLRGSSTSLAHLSKAPKHPRNSFKFPSSYPSGTPMAWKDGLHSNPSSSVWPFSLSNLFPQWQTWDRRYFRPSFLLGFRASNSVLRFRSSFNRIESEVWSGSCSLCFVLWPNPWPLQWCQCQIGWS